jgi:hypothetical protein
MVELETQLLHDFLKNGFLLVGVVCVLRGTNASSG